MAQAFSDDILQLEDNKERDFYENELQVLRLAQAVAMIHQKYAEMVIEYYQILKDMEVQRARTIKQAIKTYSERLEEAHESKTGLESLEQLSKGEEEKLIEEFYCLEEIVPLKTQLAVKNKISTEEEGFSLGMLQQYLKK